MLKNYRELIVEVVLLATVVGLIPELFVGAIQDLYGPCGFNSTVCNAISIQGAVKSVFIVICTIFATVISFILSKEFKGESSS